MISMLPRFFRASKVAQLTGLQRHTVDKMFDRGTFSGYRANELNWRYIDRRSVVRFLRDKGLADLPDGLLYRVGLLGVEKRLASEIREWLSCDDFLVIEDSMKVADSLVIDLSYVDRVPRISTTVTVGLAPSDGLPLAWQSERLDHVFAMPVRVKELVDLLVSKIK